MASPGEGILGPRWEPRRDPGTTRYGPAGNGSSLNDAGPAFRRLKQLLPGPYPVRLPASREVPRYLQDKQTVGLRIPDHPFCRALARLLGEHGPRGAGSYFGVKYTPLTGLKPGRLAKRRGSEGSSNSRGPA
ncbi:MAG: Sua5/YciO/YrdC/YwlC family protein [Acidobacteria bacterium]|nr:Sua5/YciO/YrdC/YwlC family protein [Acidobacteriota bacterium]